MTMTTETPNDSSVFSPSLRILCLHDAGSSARELKEQLSIVADRLYRRHGIDFVYLNAPVRDAQQQLRWYDDANEEKEDESVLASVGEDVLKSIKHSAAPEASKAKTTPSPNILYDASLLWLHQAWRSLGCQGILGVGQGALMAHSLVQSFAQDNTGRVVIVPPQFAIFAAAGASVVGVQHLDDDSIPTLHILRNAACPAPAEQLLVDHYSFEAEHYNAHGQSKTALYNAMGRFICRQAAASNTTAITNSIPKLQAALAQAEHQAHDLVASHLAAHPPAALLAILQSPSRMALPNQRATAPLRGAPYRGGDATSGEQEQEPTAAPPHGNTTDAS